MMWRSRPMRKRHDDIDVRVRSLIEARLFYETLGNRLKICHRTEEAE